MPDLKALNKPKVCIFQPVMAHYRESFFDELSKNEHFDIRFIAGENYLDIKQTNDVDYIALKHLRFGLLGHNFYYLKGAIRYLFKQKPKVIISGGIDFHLIHTILIFIVFRLILRRKFVWWSHASAGNQGKLGLFTRLFLYKRANGVLTYSKKGQDFLIENGVSPNRIATLGNAINYRNYGYLNETMIHSKKNKELNIIFSGRINENRRLDILLKALAIVKKKSDFDFKCYIIGNGDVSRLKEVIIELKLEGEVILTGPLYDNDIAKFLNKADLMVYPKAIGLSLLHAHSFGIPVITTNNMAIQMPEIELLKPGVTGDFYEDGNERDLADAICIWQDKLIRSSKEISQQCINRVKKLKYLPHEMASTMTHFMSKTCSTK